VRQRYLITNTIRRADGVLARIVSANAPHPDATPLAATLEDAYLYAIARRPEAVQ